MRRNKILPKVGFVLIVAISLSFYTKNNFGCNKYSYLETLPKSGIWISDPYSRGLGTNRTTNSNNVFIWRTRYWT